MQTKETMN